jgi:hypothetical protein
MTDNFHKYIDLEESIIIKEQISDLYSKLLYSSILEHDTLTDKEKVDCLEYLPILENEFNNKLEDNNFTDEEFTFFNDKETLNEDIVSTVLSPITVPIKMAANQIGSMFTPNTVENRMSIRRKLNELKVHKGTAKEKINLIYKIGNELESLRTLNTEKYKQLDARTINKKISSISSSISRQKRMSIASKELVNRYKSQSSDISAKEFDRFQKSYNSININFQDFVEYYIENFPFLSFVKFEYPKFKETSVLQGELTNILADYKLALEQASQLYDTLKASSNLSTVISNEERNIDSSDFKDKSINRLEKDARLNNTPIEILKGALSSVNKLLPWNWGSSTWTTLGISGLIAGISLGAYYLWKKFYKIKCDGLEGIELTKCEIKATNKAIDEAESQKRRCLNELNPTKCKEEVEVIIQRWKDRKSMLMDQLEAKESKPFNKSENDNLF